mmetsp:Transcript_19407/g.48872  ORF Transcript_19407/g.48872 Transcript_19407/m.48872 type:complete len:276 (+) Transcript_19407:209-1036(+)
MSCRPRPRKLLLSCAQWQQRHRGWRRRHLRTALSLRRRNHRKRMLRLRRRKGATLRSRHGAAGSRMIRGRDPSPGGTRAVPAEVEGGAAGAGTGPGAGAEAGGVPGASAIGAATAAGAGAAAATTGGRAAGVATAVRSRWAVGCRTAMACRPTACRATGCPVPTACPAPTACRPTEGSLPGGRWRWTRAAGGLTTATAAQGRPAGPRQRVQPRPQQEEVPRHRGQEEGRQLRALRAERRCQRGGRRARTRPPAGPSTSTAAPVRRVGRPRRREGA